MRLGLDVPDQRLVVLSWHQLDVIAGMPDHTSATAADVCAEMDGEVAGKRPWYLGAWMGFS